MHIPDGYLSPSTCAALYGAASPFWYVALKRIKSRLHGSLVPRLSLFAAFSFVVMMFNLPLPGGTTGHATGTGIAAILLGPWAGMLAISIALLMQAIFFGDGGITAFGANSFNMAIIGCLVASALYRVIARKSLPLSNRRVVAAAVAGYAAINAAALLAAIEFGIQPLLFHDTAGAPLYAPYPLSIAVPAMMVGHLTFAGLAEMILTGGLVAYLQRTMPTLLISYNPPSVAPVFLKRLWVGLAFMILLTPLGLLSVGPAWGEWSPADFSNRNGRAMITSATGGASPPAQSPSGLRQLSAIWIAPLPGYTVPLLKKASSGYVISAFSGVALIALTGFCIFRFTNRNTEEL